ncbi:MAG: hypothetical protein RIF32_01585 [Leptospirales bacterium]|jgi:hypothetical protein
MASPRAAAGPADPGAKRGPRPAGLDADAGLDPDIIPDSDSDFMERTRAAPLVFRFFNGADRCAAYLAGRWEGTGIQAIPAWPTEAAMRLTLALDPERGRPPERSVIRLDLRGRPPRQSLQSRLYVGLQGLWHIAFSRGEGVRHAQQNVAGDGWAGFRKSLAIGLPAADSDSDSGNSLQSSFGPDFARLGEGDWELTLQVLENVRAHAQLRRVDGLAPIYFSGVLRKTR